MSFPYLEDPEAPLVKNEKATDDNPSHKQLVALAIAIVITLLAIAVLRYH